MDNFLSKYTGKQLEHMLELTDKFMKNPGQVITTLSEEDHTEYEAVLKYIHESFASLQRLYDILNYGVICGDAKGGARVATVTTGTEAEDPMDPDKTKDTEVVQPNTIPPTVPNIAVTLDTSENLIKYNSGASANLIDGSPCFTTDTHKFFIFYQGNFYGGGSGGSSGGGISADELMALFLDHLGFKAEDGYSYRMVIDANGVIQIYRYESTDLAKGYGKSDVWVSSFFTINSFFCGGKGDAYSFQSCSHNFVELANSGTTDINLQDIYLLYAPNPDSPWHVLPLRGVIKAGHTFLIRGKQCSIKTNTTIIPVDTYDMEWLEDGELISFDQDAPTFYLAYGEGGKFYNMQDVLVEPSALPRTVWDKSKLIKGYIDSVSVGLGGEGGSPIMLPIGAEWSNCIFMRRNQMDPSSQANSAYNKHVTSSLWTVINLTKSTVIKPEVETKDAAANNEYYWTDAQKRDLIPRSSAEDKTIFNAASKFSRTSPNIVNITFGIQATDNGNGATRCFNWVSEGYYDEKVMISTDQKNWKEYHSVDKVTDKQIDILLANKSTDDQKKVLKEYLAKFYSTYDSGINDMRQRLLDLSTIYGKLRWITTSLVAVTSHKVIVKGLTAGTYYYKVVREGDESYTSPVMKFTVRANSDCKEFSFVQVTDQQGFNWQEYIAWRKSSDFIAKVHPEAHFTINTGDITQDGNRENEWIDYYEGRYRLRDKEEMFTIGNNDLCGVVEHELGDGTASVYKINHNNIFHYFTFELDEDNLPMFTSGDTRFCMPSIYSYNYGDYHFVSLNSEFASNTYKVYTDKEGNFIPDSYSQMADWFKKDLQIWKGIKNDANPTNCGKCIVYIHELPFTIITHETAIDKSGRSGSKLNTIKTNGKLFAWSRLFYQYGIRLVIGGHKHTFSFTYPIYDAPEGYIDNGTHKPVDGANIWADVNTDAQMQPVIQVTSTDEMSSEVNDNRADKLAMGRYELVSRITAPVYVTCQATGYKLVSNKEIPCRASDHILWIRKYFPGNENKAKDSANGLQYYPNYTNITCRETGIDIDCRQILNIYSEASITKGGSFDINAQISDELKDQQILPTYKILL